MATDVSALQQQIIDATSSAALASLEVTEAATADATPDTQQAYQASVAQQLAAACQSLCAGLMQLQAGPVKSPDSATGAKPPSLYA